MSRSELFEQLVGLFVGAARAHHEATGGPNTRWADWYAEYLIDDLNEVLGEETTVEALSAWLKEADHRYTSETPDLSWPKAYANWMLDDRQLS